MPIDLWLDDIRDPVKYGAAGFTWVKTADEAIDLLRTGEVERASLDHDLAPEHYPHSGIAPAEQKEKTGMDVVAWMVENGIWPQYGVRVHSANEFRKRQMILAIGEHYVTYFD